MRSDREPWLEPMRIARPCSRQNRTRGVNSSLRRSSSSRYSASEYSRTSNFFLSTKLPGLIRIFSTHLAASIAASGLKWISATRGTWQPAARNSREIFSKLAAYALVWAVRRIISQLQSLLHAGIRIPRIGRQHGLDPDGIGTAHPHIPHHDFTGYAARISIRTRTIGRLHETTLPRQIPLSTILQNGKPFPANPATGKTGAVPPRGYCSTPASPRTQSLASFPAFRGFLHNTDCTINNTIDPI